MHHLGLQLFHRQAAQLAVMLAHLFIQLADFLAVLLDLRLSLAQLLLGALDLPIQPGQLARLELVPLAHLLYFQDGPLVRLVGLAESLPCLARGLIQVAFLRALAVRFRLPRRANAAGFPARVPRPRPAAVCSS